ncbi:hypothetical protein [Tunturiibacter psychrotolerans]|uniref:hypothetical protein n=1 Tax=Tunturiibacter psychrotolerans TaxID=3069686 RepID=UPI003D24E62C
MNDRINRFRTADRLYIGFCCSLFVFLCNLVARPFFEMGCVDDWSYIKTAQIFAGTGHFVYNNWSTAMLGWQIPLGALGIKLFGFSFSAARLYMFPVTFCCVWIYYAVARNSGLKASFAVFSTIALFLSPVCFPLESIAMSDIPGLLAILLCLLMCQKAFRSRTAAGSILWICAASATNVLGGSVRQIAWLGCLVLVPTTTWLLRRRAGVIIAGTLSTAFAIVCVAAMIHWFNHTAGAVPERIFDSNITPHGVGHMLAQFSRATLTFQFLLIPVEAIWLYAALRRSSKLVLSSGTIFLAALVAFTFAAYSHSDAIRSWLMPFSRTIISSLGFGNIATNPTQMMLGDPVFISTWISIVLSAATIATTFIFILYLCTKWHIHIAVSRTIREFDQGEVDPDSWHAVVGLLAPLLLANIFFLIPRSFSLVIQDKYLITILALAQILILRLMQDASLSIPSFTKSLLAVYCLVIVAMTHDEFSLYRARVLAAKEVMATGVPSTSIQAGADFDGWTELEAAGRMANDESAISIIKLPSDCSYWFAYFTPAISPRVFIMTSIPSCFQPSRLPEIRYSSWLPPYHRTIFIGTLRDPYNLEPYIVLHKDIASMR